jgi:CubicO group peptidase (beta-lactamase class C family)
LVQVNGLCDPRFARVRDALSANLASGKEVGVSLYVSIDGEEVVDLWGGWRDKEQSAPWTGETVVNVFSASKTVTSLAVLMLVDRGDIDLSAPVSEYWPEFGKAGKEAAQVRHLLSHTVGLPAWDPPFSMAEAMDVESSTARLAAQAPWWEPGTRGSYHASTFGHLNAELVQRVTGKRLSRFIDEEIVRPLQADFYLGLSDDMFDRVATVYPVESDGASPSSNPAGKESPQSDSLAIERAISARTRLGSFSGQKRDAFALFNSPEWRRTEFGGSTGHANARGLGRIMTTLAHSGVSRGVKLISPETIALIFQEQFHGVDSYYMKPIRWGVGYALAPLHEKERGPLPFLRPGPRTCYWYGAGGSLSLADAERGIAIGYAMNQCQSGRNSPNGTYYDAIYDSL